MGRDLDVEIPTLYVDLYCLHPIFKIKVIFKICPEFISFDYHFDGSHGTLGTNKNFKQLSWKIWHDLRYYSKRVKDTSTIKVPANINNTLRSYNHQFLTRKKSQPIT